MKYKDISLQKDLEEITTKGITKQVKIIKYAINKSLYKCIPPKRKVLKYGDARHFYNEGFNACRQEVLNNLGGSNGEKG